MMSEFIIIILIIAKYVNLMKVINTIFIKHI